MKSVCIVGAGPSGLFLSKYLSDFFKIDIFEKSKDILGYYKYSLDCKRRPFEKILKNKNINLFLNSDIEKLPEGYDAYGIAIGGVAKPPFHPLATNAVELIEKNFSDIKKSHKDFLIVGMGNVTIDILHFLSNIAKKVTVVLRSEKPSCENYRMKEIAGKYKIFENQHQKNFANKNFENQTQKNLANKIWNKISNFFLNPEKPKLNLIYNSKVTEISKLKINKFEITINENSKTIADSVISSIGFDKNSKFHSKTFSKPVYHLGWCKKASGNINDMRNEAEILAEQIINDLY